MTVPGRDTDGELLTQIAARDAEALGVFYERYEAIVAAFLIRRTGDAELVADLVAETFAAVILSARSYRGDADSAAGWVLGIARNLLLRHWQRGRVERRAQHRLGLERTIVSDGSLERIDAVLDAADPHNPVLAALQQLPVTQREAVRAYVLEERPYPELAARLGVPEATVRQRVSRGLARLRTTVEGRS